MATLSGAGVGGGDRARPPSGLGAAAPLGPGSGAVNGPGSGAPPGHKAWGSASWSNRPEAADRRLCNFFSHLRMQSKALLKASRLSPWTVSSVQFGCVAANHDDDTNCSILRLSCKWLASGQQVVIRDRMMADSQLSIFT